LSEEIDSDEEETVELRDVDNGTLEVKGKLLPLLTDELVAGKLWPRMFAKPSPSLLFRLRWVSQSWYNFVGA
jgi:hypothetical protein